MFDMEWIAVYGSDLFRFVVAPALVVLVVGGWIDWKHYKASRERQIRRLN